MEQKPTREEFIKGLKDAIEVQTLQTELAELRARMYLAHAKELQATFTIDQMTNPPEESTDQKEAKEEFEKVQEEVTKERKLKTE